jgi:flagellar hook protein FlgE
MNTGPAGKTGLIGSLQFGQDGALVPSTTSSPVFNVTIPATAGGAANISATMDYSGSTQYGSPFIVNALSQDGYASGRLTGFNTGADGIITGRYSNGKSSTLGQVVLTNFTNVNGLQPLGNNVWAESTASGPPLAGAPSSGTFGALQSSAVEDSNVDLTAELVNMITAQRVYQANAQTVKTQDQVLQTLVNLR